MFALALATVLPALSGLSAASFSTGTVSEAPDAAYGALPLSFVPNRGQAGADVAFSARAGGFAVEFTQREARLAFAGGDTGHLLALRFLGANPAPSVVGRAPSEEKVSYFVGSDPTAWRTGLATFGEVVYRDLWPGIDMTFRGRGGALKYEFLVRPGADPNAIRLAYAGAGALAIDRGGNLSIPTAVGTLTDARPTAYQVIDGRRVPVAASYALSGSSRYGFALGAHEAGSPLIVDPGIGYSTYLGGAGGDQGRGIAANSSGHAYVTGLTTSSAFPTTPGAYDPTYAGSYDIFVTKLNAEGTSPIYSTFIGGTSEDQVKGFAVDPAGNAYVTGITGSTDYPTTPGAFDATYNDGFDAFATKLNADGTALAYSTFLGGAGNDQGMGIGVDASGRAHVSGATMSSNFPTTPTSYDTSFNGDIDVFVTTLDAAGSTLVSSTYIGASTTEQGMGIVVDGPGNAYVTGSTDNAMFPSTQGAFDTTHNGATDAFVAKLNPSATTLEYSTFIGGTGADQGLGIGMGPDGTAVITGSSSSTAYPTTLGAFDTVMNGGHDVIVTKVAPDGASLDYSTFLGGSSTDLGLGIAVHPAGAAYVTGMTTSANFPTTPGAFDLTTNGGSDPFVTKVNDAGTALSYSTYLGGSAADPGGAIAVDPAGSAYVTGTTDSTNFPTLGGMDSTHNGLADAFVTKVTGTTELVTVTSTNRAGDTLTVEGTSTYLEQPFVTLATDPAGDSVGGPASASIGADTVAASAATTLGGSVQLRWTLAQMPEASNGTPAGVSYGWTFCVSGGSCYAVVAQRVLTPSHPNGGYDLYKCADPSCAPAGWTVHSNGAAAFDGPAKMVTVSLSAAQTGAIGAKEITPVEVSDQGAAFVGTDENLATALASRGFDGVRNVAGFRVARREVSVRVAERGLDPASLSYDTTVLPSANGDYAASVDVGGRSGNLAIYARACYGSNNCSYVSRNVSL